MRRITIKWKNASGYEEQIHQDFIPNGLSPDSQALHHLLCEWNPGDTYTVEFTNV